MTFPRGVMGCLRFVIVVFPDHTHYFSSRVDFDTDTSKEQSIKFLCANNVEQAPKDGNKTQLIKFLFDQW